MVTAGGYRHLKWQKEISDMRWKINFEDLMLTNQGKSNKSNSSIGGVSNKGNGRGNKQGWGN